MRPRPERRVTFATVYNIYNIIEKEDGWGFGLDQSFTTGATNAATLSLKLGKHGNFTAAYRIRFD